MNERAMVIFLTIACLALLLVLLAVSHDKADRRPVITYECPQTA
jgi:hypothetical protein